MPGPRVKFSPIIIISHDLSNVKSIWRIFFASNFEGCVCTTIDAVSNFHISWELQLQAGRRLSNFQADGSCNSCQILYVARSCNSCIFARPLIKLEHRQNLKYSEKFLLLLLLFPFYYIIFLKKFQIFFAHKKRHRDFSLCPYLYFYRSKIWLTQQAHTPSACPCPQP